MSKAAPRYTIRITADEQYELFDHLYDVVLQTFQFETDAESACYLKNCTDNTE